MSQSPRIINMSDTISPNLALAIKLLKKKKHLDEFSKFRKNSTWLINNKEKLRKKIGDRYVAIRNEKICSKNKDLSKLLINVHKKYGNSQDICIDYIGSKRVNFVL